jgi:hypothetical protein
MRAGFHDNPARNRPRGRAIPPGVAAGPSKLPMTSPSAGRTTATGAVLYCNPAADTEGRVSPPRRAVLLWGVRHRGTIRLALSTADDPDEYGQQ